LPLKKAKTKRAKVIYFEKDFLCIIILRNPQKFDLKTFDDNFIKRSIIKNTFHILALHNRT